METKLCVQALEFYWQSAVISVEFCGTNYVVIKG